MTFEWTPEELQARIDVLETTLRGILVMSTIEGRNGSLAWAQTSIIIEKVLAGK